MATRFYFDVSIGIEEELPQLQERILPLLIGREYFADITFVHAKGSVVPHEWISVFMDCSKEVAKLLVPLIAQELISHYRDKKIKSKETERKITLYGPDSHVYKSFTIVGDGKDTTMTDQKEDCKFSTDAWS